MQFFKYKFKFWAALFLISLSANAFAEEKSEEKTEAPAAAPSESNADREWAKKNTKLNVLETKIKDLNKQMAHLIHVKKTGGAALDEKGKPIDVLESMATAHKKLKETVTEYNTEKAELKYRHPEEGARIDRRYVPMRVQSLEQIEKNNGLDGELSRTKQKIDKKYATFIGDEFAKPAPTQAAQPESTLRDTKKEKESQSQRLKLSQ